MRQLIQPLFCHSPNLPPAKQVFNPYRMNEEWMSMLSLLSKVVRSLSQHTLGFCYRNFIALCRPSHLSIESTFTEGHYLIFSQLSHWCVHVNIHTHTHTRTRIYAHWAAVCALWEKGLPFLIKLGGWCVLPCHMDHCLFLIVLRADWEKITNGTFMCKLGFMAEPRSLPL